MFTGLFQQMHECLFRTLWTNLTELFFVENNTANPVTMIQCCPCQQATCLDRCDRLEVETAAKEQAVALVQQYQNRTCRALPETLGMGFAAPGRYPPVDGTDIVTMLIGTNFFKVDAGL